MTTFDKCRKRQFGFQLDTQVNGRVEVELGSNAGASGDVGQIFQGSVGTHLQPGCWSPSALSASDTERTEHTALCAGVLVPVVFQVPTNLCRNLKQFCFLFFFSTSQP